MHNLKGRASILTQESKKVIALVLTGDSNIWREGVDLEPYLEKEFLQQWLMNPLFWTSRVHHGIVVAFGIRGKRLLLTQVAASNLHLAF